MTAAGAHAPRTLALSLRATPEQVMEGVEALQAFCRAHGMDEPATYALMLALEELGANVANHAYGGDASRAFRVSAERTGDGIAIEVRDDGPPFDPLAPRPGPVDVDPDDPPIGGLGITLVRRSVDELRYTRAGTENVLSFLKRIPSSP